MVLGALLCGTPPAIHWIAAQTARARGPVIGPIISYTPLLAAITFAATDRVRGVLVSFPSIRVHAVFTNDRQGNPTPSKHSLLSGSQFLSRSPRGFGRTSHIQGSSVQLCL